jgi:hypothetical protein
MSMTCNDLREVTTSYIYAYMCTKVLFIEGLTTSQKYNKYGVFLGKKHSYFANG